MTHLASDRCRRFSSPAKDARLWPARRRLGAQSRSAKRRQVLTMPNCLGVKRSLPTDIIINDILPRVPAEVLHSWRCTCKQWFQLMCNEPTFIDAQLAKSKRKFIFDVDVEDYYHKQVEVDIVFNEITRTITSFTCSSIYPNKFNWINEENGSKIAIDVSVQFSSNSCNGLILLEHMKNDKLSYIVNPVTGQCVSLPQCNFSICCGGLGYDPSSRKYKAVYFFRELDMQTRRMHNGCEVLTLGTSTWRRIELPFEYFYDLDRPILVGKYLHFRCKCWSGPYELLLYGCSGKPYLYDAIASMDIANETCQVTKPPDVVTGRFNLLTIGESLALAPHDNPRRDHMDIWVLEDSVKGHWSRKYSITKALYYGCGRNLRSKLPEVLLPIATLNNGEVVIFQEYDGLRLFYFVVGCNKFKEIQTPWKKVHGGDPCHPVVVKVFDHISTLASPHTQ